MRSTLAVGVGFALCLPALAATAATKPPIQQAPPACAAITFRPLPSGMTDGEQQAGTYKSRYARLALHAQVKQGEPVDYFVLAGGKRLAAAPASQPETAASLPPPRKCRRRELPRHPAPGNALRSRWPTLGTNAWQCSMLSTVPPGAFAALEHFDELPDIRSPGPAPIVSICSRVGHVEKLVRE